MSSFTTELEYEKVPKKHFWDKQLYILTAPFRYYIGSEDSKDYVEAETGFIHNFASTPCLVWWLYPPIGWYAKPAVIHDKVYDTHGFWRITDKGIVWVECTKEEAEEILKEGMEVMAHFIDGAKISKDKQTTINRFYWAVTNFGEKAWDKHRAA